MRRFHLASFTIVVIAVCIGCAPSSPRKKLVGVWEHKLQPREVIEVKTKLGESISRVRLDEAVYDVMLLRDAEEQYTVERRVFVLNDRGESLILELEFMEDETCKMGFRNHPVLDGPLRGPRAWRAWGIESADGAGVKITVSRTGLQPKEFSVTFEGPDQMTLSPVDKETTQGVNFQRVPVK